MQMRQACLAQMVVLPDLTPWPVILLPPAQLRMEDDAELLPRDDAAASVTLRISVGASKPKVYMSIDI